MPADRGSPVACIVEDRGNFLRPRCVLQQQFRLGLERSAIPPRTLLEALDGFIIKIASQYLGHGKPPRVMGCLEITIVTPGG